MAPIACAVKDPCDTPGQGSVKYWFYVEPPCYTYYDPTTGPNYVGVVSDDWVTDSVVESIDWASFAGSDEYIEFSFWLVVKNSDSHETKVVISINNAAYDGIEEIWINEVEITSWISTSFPPGHPILDPHGVFNSAEFYGYYEYGVGYLMETKTGGRDPTCEPVEIVFEVKLNDDATNDIKIHLDAYGCEGSGPYSHDAIACYWPDFPTMVINETALGSIAAVAAGLVALLLLRTKGFYLKI